MKHGHSKPTQAGLVVPLPQPPQLLQSFIPGPPIRRDLENLLLDIHEAHLLVDLAQVARHHDGAADVLAGPAHVVHPARHGAVGGHAAIVTEDSCVELVRLEVAARVEVLEGLLGDLRLEGGPAAGGDAGVDVVEGLGVFPELRSGRGVSILRLYLCTLSSVSFQGERPESEVRLRLTSPRQRIQRSAALRLAVLDSGPWL